MKMIFTKSDIMGILCEHFNIKTITALTGGDRDVMPSHDQIYWEGNPEIDKEN